VAGLWFSEAADVWDDNRDPYASAKRTLYIAIRHQQLPLDVVTDGDDLTLYRLLYLTDRHVSRAGSEQIAAWVRQGGRLIATAGAGLRDEFNQPNHVLETLLGVDESTLEVTDRDLIRWEKQDLPFAHAVDAVHVMSTPRVTVPVFAVRSRFESRGSQVWAAFRDGSPACTTTTRGRGTAVYCGFLPGLSYFQPAMPLRPVDRGAESSLAHFIPTAFDRNAQALLSVALGQNNVTRPVRASEPLVETTVIESTRGTVIPLINWSGHTVRGLRITMNMDARTAHVSLASGGQVRIARKEGETIFSMDLDVADALILR
jgi:hypothetical protein